MSLVNRTLIVWLTDAEMLPHSSSACHVFV